jgi:hypothetical protein
MDHADNALRASIKALEEVVAPAVDPGDPLAAEQLQLVIHTLGFLRDRIDHIHARARFDLRHDLGLASALLDDAPALRDPIATGTALAADPDTPTAALRAGAAMVAAAIRTVVRDADDSVRRRIELRVVSAAHQRIELERAWHLPQGFDPDPASVSPLAAALRA